MICLCVKVIVSILKPYVGNVSWCVLENVNSRSAQGVKPVFSFGERFGALKGVLESMGVNYHMVNPGAWQKYYDLIGKGKDVVEHQVNIKNKCHSYYPDVNYYGQRAA